MTEAPEPADGGGPGRTTVADRAVEQIAAAAAREVDGVHGSRTGPALPLVGRRLPHAEARVAGDQARIGVEIAGTWPTPAPDLAARVRDHVLSRVADLAPVTVLAVDVDVVEIVQPHEQTRRVR